MKKRTRPKARGAESFGPKLKDSDFGESHEELKRKVQRLSEQMNALKEAIEKDKEKAIKEAREEERRLAKEDKEQALKEVNVSVIPNTQGLNYIRVISKSSSSSPKKNWVSYQIHPYPYLEYIDFSRGSRELQGFKSAISPNLLHDNITVKIESEAKVAFFVSAYIIDLLVGMGLGRQYYVGNEIGKFGLRPDLYVLYSQDDSPVGIIEVKKPSFGNDKSPLEDVKVLGQAYDYLMLLKTMHGVEHPVGLVTTMKEFRVCWLEELPDISPLGKLEVLDTPPPKSDGSSTSDSKAPVEPKFSPEEPTLIKLPRKMRVSAVFSTSENADAASRIIGSSLYAMMACRSDPNKDPFKDPEGGDGRIYPVIVLNKWGIFWSKVMKAASWKLSGLAVPPMPVPTCNHLCLLKCLGIGSHGCCWLAGSLQGSLCVLKFPHSLQDEKNQEPAVARINKEKYFWTIAHHNLNVTVQRWRKITTLVMPYFAQASVIASANIRDAVNAADKETQDAVRAELENFASKGLEHQDIKWANIGFYSEEENGFVALRAVLIDLMLIRKHKVPWKDAGEWVKSSMHKLIEELKAEQSTP